MNVTTNFHEDQAGLDSRNRQSSAVTGASAAFRNSQSSWKPTSDAGRNTNTALVAASMAGICQRERPSQSPSFHRSLNRATPTVPEENRSRVISHISFPNESKPARRPSPSHIAATVAAARSNPSCVVKNISNASPGTTRSPSPASSSLEPISVPVTNALINFFEDKSQYSNSQNSCTKASKREDRSLVTAGSSAIRPIVSLPKQSTLQQDVVKPSRGPSKVRLNDASVVGIPHTTDGLEAPEYSEEDPKPPQPPPWDIAGGGQSLNVSSIENGSGHKKSSGPSYSGQSSSVSPNRNSPSGVSEYPSGIGIFSSRTADGPRTSNLQPFSTALPILSPIPSRPSIQQFGRSGSTPNLPTTTDNPKYQISADDLANAMVASSLASTRASSPTRTALPWRQSRPVSLIYQSYVHSQEVSRTPSPSKTMRTTLRHHPRKDKDKEPTKRNHLINKHPNKHNEGDRKRWRDEITEKERKRYEGVWAANRGILIPSSEVHDQVHSLIVRDIWRRSQLSNSMLADVWDLVDRQGRGMLYREEFVVGLWLIDQCLKGRKLPVRVSESVWSSVRRLTGIVIPGV